jgi:hypothetical protein
MCFDKNIDDVLEQMKHCHDPKEKRRLLEKITPCKTCPEEKPSSHPPCNCSCQKEYQTELMNMIEHIRRHPIGLKE